MCGMRLLSAFDDGSVSSSIGLLKCTPTIATASGLLAISRKAAHFAVTVIVNVAAAICVVAAVVHAIMSEELLLAFKVGSLVFIPDIGSVSD